MSANERSYLSFAILLALVCAAQYGYGQLAIKVLLGIAMIFCLYQIAITIRKLIKGQGDN